MNTALKRVVMTTAAVAVVAGLGAATLNAGAQARGWGDGPGYGQGMGGGPCGGRMMHGPGGMRGGSGGPGGLLLVMDADEDGTVTRAEFDRFHELGFAAMDADGDGQVARADFIEGRQGTMAGRGGMRQGPNSDWRAEVRADRLGQRFDVWDANADGVVTADEFSAANAARFDSLDVDGDGSVETQEAAAARMFGPRGPAMSR
ncbi:hypothetical protein [uncultured Rhodospira sp.]|mgnify:CR=1 FL=1|uniref:EF-hand domain-containing protein n=1 Tax=uncultured Rhodospira sp. TaxID=1936189 RepID=UPI00263A2C89|nr:hypothetical protein [uncultured Rhodospira sp.]